MGARRSLSSVKSPPLIPSTSEPHRQLSCSYPDHCPISEALSLGVEEKSQTSNLALKPDAHSLTSARYKGEGQADSGSMRGTEGLSVAADSTMTPVEFSVNPLGPI
jgi:hypothetical protein